MEGNTSLIESLIERAAEYGKTSFELAKLKAVDKTSDVVSSFVPRAVVVVFILSFMLFFNLGLSLWLGEILGKTFYGFFVVAGFYGIIGIFIQLFMRNRIKRCVSNNFINQVLK
jgi:hypothetical protein